jgi:hypothetical protein
MVAVLIVFSRYDYEPENLRTKPGSFYDRESAPEFGPERHTPLMDRIRAHLRGAQVGR